MNSLEPSILISMKLRIDLDADDELFNEAMLQSINSALANLVQNGVGPRRGFFMSDDTSKWEDFLGSTMSKLNEEDAYALLQGAKDYVYCRCKLVFDTPTAAIVELFKGLADEALWRCRAIVESTP